MAETKKPFRSINIPTILVVEIEQLIKDKKTLHNNKSSFIEDAVRRHIEYTKNKDKIPKEFLDIFQHVAEDQLNQYQQKGSR